ncbi:MAG: FAD-dependent oxidoreductase [Candidatus Thermoplasmatota archaeon]|nr:FAD-dependent oxidoreductase [Candidatus Thermoplasmatota archaeon]
MSEFDAIVVGAGPAGTSAASKMASSGMNVLLVERGDPPGSKNVSGGILWGKDLSKLYPDWEKTAPLERFITNKVTGFLTEDSSISIDFKTKRFERQRTGYSVLRTKLDGWLAKKAKDSGATVITGITVDGLARDGNKVIGVRQENDVITSDLVVLAEGANPRIAIDEGLRQPINDHDVAIGIKQVFKFSEQTINERFNLRNGAGFAGEYSLGFLNNGVKAGGFLYTNKDTISLGVVIDIFDLRKDNSTYSFDIMEKFASHPYIAPYIEGGQLQEYSAHLVCEGGIDYVPKLYGNGYLIAGDSAGFSFSNGMMIQGMNYAIASGIAAGETAISAKESNDYSESMLSSYEKKLSSSEVLMDMRNFRGIQNVTWSPLVHEFIPKFTEGILYNMFNETGEPKKHLFEIALENFAGSKYDRKSLVLDLYRMMRRM